MLHGQEDAKMPANMARPQEMSLNKKKRGSSGAGADDNDNDYNGQEEGLEKGYGQYGHHEELVGRKKEKVKQDDEKEVPSLLCPYYLW